MNKVSLIGNLTKAVECGGDDELKFAKSSIAINNGKSTDFIPFTAFGKTADILQKYTDKGSKICLCGYIKNNSWEKYGKKQYQLQFIVNEVELLSKNQQNEELKPLNEDENSDLPF